MISIRVFLGVILCGIILICFISETPPNHDPFADKSAIALVDIPYTTAPAINALKLRHVIKHEPYKLGMFGNSRVLMVGNQAMGVSNEQYFNFAISSESFSGSVLLIKQMADQLLLPQHVVVGIDHFYLQRDNVPIWPNFLGRLTYSVHGILRGLHNAEKPLTTAARRAWRFVWGETVRLGMLFDPQLLFFGLARTLHIEEPLPRVASSEGGYRPDGSRSPGQKFADEIHIIQPTNSKIDVDQLRHNLSVLGELAQQGYTFFIVETPLHPTTAQKLGTLETQYMKSTRDIWHQECIRWALNCMNAPADIGDGTADRWYDESHPPEKPWAAFIKSFLAKPTRHAVQ